MTIRFRNLEEKPWDKNGTNNIFLRYKSRYKSKIFKTDAPVFFLNRCVVFFNPLNTIGRLILEFSPNHQIGGKGWNDRNKGKLNEKIRI